MAKLHWTQTPEGKLKVRQNMKAMWAARRAKANGTTRRHHRRGVTVDMEGRDVRKALAELISNIQYDNLDVHITIRTKD